MSCFDLPPRSRGVSKYRPIQTSLEEIGAQGRKGSRNPGASRSSPVANVSCSFAAKVRSTWRGGWGPVITLSCGAGGGRVTHGKKKDGEMGTNSRLNSPPPLPPQVIPALRYHPKKDHF